MIEGIIAVRKRLGSLNGHNPFPLNNAKAFGYKVAMATVEEIIKDLEEVELAMMDKDADEKFNPDEVRELCQNTEQWERGE